MSFLNGGLSWQATAAISALACATSAVATKLVLGSKPAENGTEGPQRWMKVGVVKQLVIYPIKSCQGIQVKEATVTKLGLRVGDFLRDRVFMIIDGAGVFQVQMKYGQMALISPEITAEGKVRLSAPGMDTITVELPENTPETRREVRIFKERGLKALDCGDEVAHWLQTFLENSTLRLVYHDMNKSQRRLDEFQRKFPHAVESDVAVFQNYTSYLLISQESIDELNNHLVEKVDHRPFRPSILISETPEPFAEVRWGAVKIGDARLKISRPCDRCKITTVDPDTGVHHPDREPLKTLTTIAQDFGDETTERLMKNRGIMGLQMGLLDPKDDAKVIKVGDPVYVALL